MAAQCTAQCFVQAAAPARPVRPARRSPVVCAAAAGAVPTRRQALQLATTLAVAPLLAGSASAAKVPKGFVAVKDSQDGYAFLYPFGWQEVSVDGQDVVYKDVIEPLESASVSLVPTDKKDVAEYGDKMEVAYTLAEKVLTSPSQEVSLLAVNERVTEGRRYFDFEFTAKSRGYTRHALASVTVGNGKFYTLVTGSNEKRWGKMKDKVKIVVDSFIVEDRHAPPQDSPQQGRLQRKLRDRGVRSAAKLRQQRALQRLRSGQGGVNDLLEEDSGSGGDSEEEPQSSDGGKPAWGRLAWPRPPRQLRGGSGGGTGLEDDLEDEEEEEEGAEEEEEAADWDFVVEDEDNAAAAFAELRGVTGGSAMNDDERHQLLCQLRLLRLLGALPSGAELSPEERACVAAALEIERNLKQQCEQANNLEGWRRADAGMKQKFEECPVVKRGEHTCQMGRHCAFCRHDRRKRIVLHPLRFQGSRSPVAWLEPELRRRGLLPGEQSPEHGMLHAPMGSSDEEAGAQGQPSNSDSSSSEDGETLLQRYRRRHPVQQQGQRQRQQQRQAAGHKRRRGAVQQARASSGGVSKEEEEDKEEEEEREQGNDGDESSGSDSDPPQDESDASDRGKKPRRHPRIGVDCWARAFVYHAIQRYPARLDAMLLALTRRYLDATLEEEQPGSRAGLARAVVLRYGHLLRRHWASFQRDVSDFNVLQNQRKEKTLKNARIAESLQDQLYAPTVQLERQERLHGVDIAAELARFDAAAAARRRQQARQGRRAGRAAAAAADGSEEEDSEGLLLRIEGEPLGEAAVEGGGHASPDEEEEEDEFGEDSELQMGQPPFAVGDGGSGDEDDNGSGSGRCLLGRQAARQQAQAGGGAADAAGSAGGEDEVIVIDSDGDGDAPQEQQQQQQQQQEAQQQPPAAPSSGVRCNFCGGPHLTSDCEDCGAWIKTDWLDNEDDDREQCLVDSYKFDHQQFKVLLNSDTVCEVYFNPAGENPKWEPEYIKIARSQDSETKSATFCNNNGVLADEGWYTFDHCS